MVAQDYQKLIRTSVQEPPDARKEANSSFWYGFTERGFILSPFGTRAREMELRAFYHNEYNWLGQSAISGLTKKIKATSWEISAPNNSPRSRRVRYFQEVLRQADFGRGWGVFLSKVILDYLRQDGGAYIEIIAPGNPLKAPTGPVIGISHLDSLRCYPTGDPDYPVIYYSRKGKMHLMHRSRVIHLIDMPDGDERHPGYGNCALSRAISIVMRQIHMNRYVEAKMDDKPPPGYMIASNINEGLRDAAFEKYRQEQSTDAKPFWGRTLWLYSMNPTAPAKLEQVNFSQAPETFSFKEYTELDVNAWAAAMNTDVQEIWQLTGGNLGSGQQSEILHAKSEGRAYGEILVSLERAVNDALPEALEFEFKRRDHIQSKNEADNAQTWVGVTQSVGANMSEDEKRRLLASKVEAIKDAITDENGEITRLHDADPQPETQETTVDDATPQDAPTQSTTPEQVADAEKAIQATQLDFEADFGDLLTGARDGSVERRRFGTILRDMLRRYGRDAYRDGLKDGGVEDGELDDDDEADYLSLLATQSGYVTGLGDDVYKEGGITDAEAAQRPTMWFSKSIMAFFDAGRLSADKNGLYSFEGDDGDKSCATCKRLKGTRMRFREWTRKQLRPRVDTQNYECGGWQCKHLLVKVKSRS